MSSKPHIMIVEARFYENISAMLLSGAKRALEQAGATFEVFTVPGALEIPAAIKMAADSKEFDAYVALGCVIRGETYHFEIVCNESARGITWLTIDPGLAIGNGVLTCETEEQAIERADPAKGNKGAGAVQAALSLLDIKHKLGKKN
jgi:6,7-dimethyl-8-ribityllumazine synthase